MAKCFDAWTVLPHGTLRKLTDNVWTVEGSMPSGTIQRWMTIARLGDGRLVVHNAVALDDEKMAEIEAWGTPAFLLVPNGFHRQDAATFKQRYPDMKVLCPAAAKGRVSKIVPVDGDYDTPLGDPDVSLFHWRGSGKREGGLLARSGDSAVLVVNDVVLNLPKKGGLMGFLMSPTGKLGIARLSRWLLLRDQRAFAEHLREIADAPGLSHLVVGHGEPLSTDVSERLRGLAQA